MLDFKNKTIKEIKIWMWAIVVLPIVSLAGAFFIWAFGVDTWLHTFMVFGFTVMFSIATIWWCWAMYVFRNLLNLWEITGDNLLFVIKNIKEVRSIVRDQIEADKDK